MNHLGSLVIETEHLYLRPFVLEDAPAMFENWASDPETLKYVTWDAHASSENRSKDGSNSILNQILINGRSV
jgi:ribosomal-protein-alanine N-acetyltransferase